MKIDIHNHFYPDGFLTQLAKEGPAVGIHLERDEWNRQILVQNGNRVVTITSPMTDVSRRLEDMAQAGFDMQILTLTIPSVDFFPSTFGEKMARVVNDEMAKVCQAHPQHFIPFATLPYRDANRAVSELERCVDELGFKGASIGTNVNGMGLDNEALFPLYERMADYDLPIHIHPRPPMDKETYKDYRLAPMIGFEMEICVAVVRLMMGGGDGSFPRLEIHRRSSGRRHSLPGRAHPKLLRGLSGVPGKS